MMSNFFSSPFLLFVFFSIYGIDKYSFDYTAKKYEKIEGNIGTLFYPAKNPKRMLVTFSFTPRNYSMWSWFWDEQEEWTDTSYLFVSDLRLPACWYLNDQNDNDFEKKIQNCIALFIKKQGLEGSNVFFIGSSQGAYGALYHGIAMGVKGVIAFNPQVDRESATRNLWYEELIRLSGFKDLKKIVDTSDQIPSISLYVSSYIKDFSAGQGLINAILKKNCFFMYTKVDKNHHGGANMFGFNKVLVERDMMILNTMNSES